MAALGTIRKRGVILVCIISFGLFAFIAEEAFRSCDSAKNNERQQIGEVLGEKISVQDFQKLAWCFLLKDFYSVLRAMTGSLVAAMREGIRPARIVKPRLITTRIKAAPGGRKAMF